MIAKILTIIGSGLVGFVVNIATLAITGSPHLSVLMTGICAFSLGIAAARDGLWRVDKSRKGA